MVNSVGYYHGLCKRIHHNFRIQKLLFIILELIFLTNTICAKEPVSIIYISPSWDFSNEYKLRIWRKTSLIFSLDNRVFSCKHWYIETIRSHLRIMFDAQKVWVSTVLLSYMVLDLVLRIKEKSSAFSLCFFIWVLGRPTRGIGGSNIYFCLFDWTNSAIESKYIIRLRFHNVELNHGIWRNKSQSPYLYSAISYMGS